MLRGIGQTLGRNDVEAALGQLDTTQLGVVAFQTDHDGHLDPHFLDRTDDAFRDHVAAHDAAKDVDQHRFDVAVGEDDLERLGYALLGGAAADVKEVGRLAAVQVDDVHGAHGQTRALTMQPMLPSRAT